MEFLFTKHKHNISSQSIIVLLCLLIRNTCPFKTYFFAKYYYNTFSSHNFCKKYIPSQKEDGIYIYII